MTACPQAPDCRKHWIVQRGQSEGAECALCGNWLDRQELARLLREARRAPG